MKKISFIIVLYLLVSLPSYAQQGGIGMWFLSPEKQGDQYFRNFAYQDAVDAYQRAIEKETANDPLKLKIAESFQRLNNPVEAEKWYSLIEAKESVFQPQHFLAYADALSSTGKYREAETWYKSYQEMSNDQRPARKLEGFAKRMELETKNVSSVVVTSTDFNSEASDFAPAYYQEGILFVSNRQTKQSGKVFQWDKSGFLDLYYSTPSGPVSAGIFHRNLNTPYHEGPAVVYQDGTKMIFTRNNYGTKIGKSSDGVTKLKLYFSEKTDSATWSKPVALPFNSNEFSTGHPAISKDGRTLYFASDRPGGMGKTDLYKTEFLEGAWQAPVNLGDRINTEGDEMFPFLHQDQILYFASNGHAGLGGLDVVGVDISKGDKGEVINPGAPINTQFDDFGLIVDESGSVGYFSSNRSGGAGNDDIYTFTSKKNLLSRYRVSGNVEDAVEGSPIAGIEVQLLNARGKFLESVFCEKDGSFSFEGVKVNNDYQLRVEKTGYQEVMKKFITFEEEGPLWFFNIQMRKDDSFSLYARIQEENTGNIIPGVQVSLIDNMSGKQVLDIVTDESSGDFRYHLKDKKIKDRLSFQIVLSKEGYLGKTITYNGALEKAGQINLNEVLKASLNLTKIDIGMDIGKIIDVKPIYFDLGKAKIRKDAAKELDKVVAIMKENPKIVIELGSHSDSRGSSASNLALSDKRAKASAEYVISRGIEKDRIVGKGYGEAEVLNHCKDGVTCSEKEHQENRRTEFKITKY